MFNKKMKVFLAVLSLSMLVPGFASAASYQVAKGDTLYNIGKMFHTTAGKIAADNGLTGSMIYPGQVLEVQAGVYTVVKGDSLYLIAKKYGITLYTLRKANNKWDDAIYPGQRLVIPGLSASGSQAAGGPAEAKAVVSYSSADLDLLARLITAETNGQPYNAQVAVGAVVINRVQDSRFPNTIREVIYQKDSGYYQFTPVMNGYINKPAASQAVKAAKEALYGADPTNGALYFFDDSATSKWLWSKPLAARIGDMVYVY